MALSGLHATFGSSIDSEMKSVGKEGKNENASGFNFGGDV